MCHRAVVVCCTQSPVFPAVPCSVAGVRPAGKHGGCAGSRRHHGALQVGLAHLRGIAAILQDTIAKQTLSCRSARAARLVLTVDFRPAAG